MQLLVYDLSGKLAYEWNEETFLAGDQIIRWDGKDRSGKTIPGGVYIIQISGEGFCEQLMVVRSPR
jgi:flagellar hook assembly protein FlgD